MPKGSRNLLLGIAVLIAAGAVSYWIIFGRGGNELFSSKVPANAPVGEKLPIVTIFYTTPLNWSQYGDFNFQYPSALVLKKYGLEQIGFEKRHVIVLIEASQFNSADSADTIEVNVKEGLGACSQYKKCQVVSGIVIGTESANPKIYDYFDEIVKTFKVGPQGGATAK